jgi:hypothetical protein|tara:strand:- start:9 stop:203 length:195 start_codon:yes stop_codon:yes gene_type:complete
MGVFKQKVIHHYIDKYGNECKKLILPKIINTDITFELQFGLTPPKENNKSQSIICEYETPKGIN